jgi:hypothetical protein
MQTTFTHAGAMRGALILLALCAALLFSGCSTMMHGAGADTVRSIMPKALWPSFLPLPPINISIGSAENIAQAIGKYAHDRFFDFVDIFEIGIGIGFGLGADVAALIGFVGLEYGKYTYFGVFGMDQLGVVSTDAHYVIGLPISLLVGFRALFGGETDIAGSGISGRLIGFVLFSLGYENGIGGGIGMGSIGGGGTRSGYFAVGPLGFSNAYSGAPTSKSGEIGASVAVLPIALVARVRGGAIINFFTGFFGWHPFVQPSLITILNAP